MKVLIVEDEIVNALLFEHYLRELGHEVVGVVATGRGAIAAAEKTSPDAVLMDINLMDDVDGIDAASAILEKRAVRIIFATGYDNGAIRDRAARLNPHRYLVKPITREDLQEAL
jgi:two-component system, response regulator PdtaR